MNLANIDFILATEQRTSKLPSTSLADTESANPLLVDSKDRGFLRLDHLAKSIIEPMGNAKERLIGNSDLMSVNYLLMGYLAAYPVCRIHVTNELGKNLGYGTGFLIAPTLLITNNHVLDSANMAKYSLTEFNYQYDINGRPEESYLFELQPEVFFHTNKILDYTVVAIKSKSLKSNKALADFGYLKLVEEPAKALLGEHLSIIQHPSGGPKQIAIRENELKTSSGDFVTYTTDTSPGSSGAAVFNDQWQVVALHHSGVPNKNAKGQWLCKDGTIWNTGMDENLIDWLSNEGVRISSIIRDLRSAKGNDPLFLEMSQLEEKLPLIVKMGTTKNSQAPEASPSININPINAPISTDGIYRIPIELNIRLTTTAATGALATTNVGQVTVPASSNNFEITKAKDSDYANRKGFSPDFVKATRFKITLKELLAGQEAQLAPLLAPMPTNGNVLHYHNFSVVIHKHRRQCVLTAVNIDGSKSRKLLREDNPWILDPRMDTMYQTGPSLYYDNQLDRGHMVRRLDPVWGTNWLGANDDTFHYTNSCPQHADLNRETWLGLEELILKAAQNEKLKLSVFTGPVFGPDDIPYRGVLLPMQFWKIVAMIKADGKPSVTGYLLSQPDDINTLRTQEGIREDGFGDSLTNQVPLKRIAQLTSLRFDKYSAFDPLQSVALQEMGTSNEVNNAEDIRL